MENVEIRLLFIVKERLNYSYTSVGLFNSACFVSRFFNARDVSSKVVIVKDTNQIDREVTNYNPSHVFIEALFVPPAKMKELLSLYRHKKRKWIVRIHSKPSFISNEGVAFEWLHGYRELKNNHLYVAPNSLEFVSDLAKDFDFSTHAVYLPNIYYPAIYLDKHIKHVNHTTIDVGCFSAIRPLKNQLTQAIAAVQFGNQLNKKIRFHINADRFEQQGHQVYKNIKAFFEGQTKHRLVEHPWMDHHKFINVVRGMDIGLQVSLSETFNIVAADFISNHIPLVGSSEIYWLVDELKADPNSTNDIAAKMITAHNNNILVNRAFNSLLISNVKSEIEWVNFIS